MNLKECTKSAFLLLIGLGGLMSLNSCSEKSQGQSQTISPTPGQQAMIDRKYGMFLHFGMNTYLNAEWSDGFACGTVSILILTLPILISRTKQTS